VTPNIAILEVKSPHFHMRRLWLPIFLLWIPAILLSPFIVLVLFGVCLAGRVRFGRTVSVCWAILCGLPGTHVRVSTHDTKVLVRIL